MSEALSLLSLAGSALLVIAVALALWRLLRGPTRADRMVAADTLSVIATAAIVWLAFWFENPLYLDIALVYGALAFVGVIAVARALERRQA